MKGLKVENAEEISQESEDVGGLPAKQELALRAIISHPTLKEAARAAGVSDATLWRYMQDEEFSKRLREARRDALSHTAVRIQQASSEAVTVLRDVMLKEDSPASARITAARTLLDYSFRVVELDEIKAQIEELKEFFRIKQVEDAMDAAAKEGVD